VLEYRILSLYGRDVGPHEATLALDVGQGTQVLGFRAEIALLFESSGGLRGERSNPWHIPGTPVTATENAR
jgi:hypothetical protein